MYPTALNPGTLVAALAASPLSLGAIVTVPSREWHTLHGRVDVLLHPCSPACTAARVGIGVGGGVKSKEIGTAVGGMGVEVAETGLGASVDVGHMGVEVAISGVGVGGTAVPVDSKVVEVGGTGVEVDVTVRFGAAAARHKFQSKYSPKSQKHLEM